ncbi:MAG: hypothetical protein IBX64_08850, partial [Actinobacteria bacterium]|nr:hypothetical protein [Actinomycetota bacterium]
SNTCVWTPTSPGEYKLSVYVRDKDTTRGVDAYSQIGYYRVFDQFVVLNSFTTDRASPQLTGTPITITADATGGTELYYKFWVNDGTGWTVIQDYSTSNTCVWTPTSPGEYKLSVYVKDRDTITNYIDAYGHIGYYKVVDQFVVLNSLTTDEASPQVKDTPITVTANATGGAELLYKFWVNDGTGWTVAQDYSTSNSFVWRPTTAGEYKISVYVKYRYTTKGIDAYGQISYYKIVEPVTINSLIADPDSPQPAGTTITITADATGGTKPLLYEFRVDDVIVQAYSSSYSFTWTPTVVGRYTIGVYVKEMGSTKPSAYGQIGNYRIN